MQQTRHKSAFTFQIRHNVSCNLQRKKPRSAFIPPAWILGGEMLQDSGSPPAPRPWDGLSSSQISHGHHENQGAGRQNNHRTWAPLPSCNTEAVNKWWNAKIILSLHANTDWKMWFSEIRHKCVSLHPSDYKVWSREEDLLPLPTQFSL